MERTRKSDWLIAQGYRTSTLPPVVTWYNKDREWKGKTDDYTLNLYRSKGFVLDSKYLDPQLWNQLEYRVDHPRMTVAPPVPLGTTPRLAKAIRGAIGKRVFWEVTPVELLSLIGSSKQGIPKTPLGLSIEIMKPHMTDALKSYGMTVERKRTESQEIASTEKYYWVITPYYWVILWSGSITSVGSFFTSLFTSTPANNN